MRYTDKEREIFTLSAESLAPWLLGKLLCRKLPDGKIIKVKICEVEAYNADDTANYGYGFQGNGGDKHATKANTPLFEQGGTCCIYAGMFLIVAGETGKSDNVLIRACADKENKYCGPLKTADVLKISSSKNLHGADILNSEEIWLEDDTLIGAICISKRIGLGKNVNAKDSEKRCRFIAI